MLRTKAKASAQLAAVVVSIIRAPDLYQKVARRLMRRYAAIVPGCTVAARLPLPGEYPASRPAMRAGCVLFGCVAALVNSSPFLTAPF